jgi:hypothetical protein
MRFAHSQSFVCFEVQGICLDLAPAASTPRIRCRFTLHLLKGITMKVHVQPIALTPASLQSSERIVKRGALSAFRLLRAAIGQASTVPGILAQASADVRDAWQESSRPNV